MMVIGRGIESREKEGNMSKRLASGLGAVLALAAVFAVWVVGSAAAGKAACGTVVLNEQAWAGSTANTYVAKYVLEKNFGCTVKVTQITEIPVYQAMASGKVDAVLEDWQHVAQYKQFVTKQKTVVLVGSNGLQGHIGWFIPKYLLKQYPQFKTWNKSPESGSQGMFLGGDPSYEQKDTQLIQALGLNFKHVTVGAEPAEVARFTQTIKQHKPVIFYWWTPQYLNKNLDLAEVKLPARFKGCQDDASAGGNVKQYRCAYATYPLEKLFSKKFATSGSPAVSFLRKWRWPSNVDQNYVANLIAGQHMDPAKAAETWIKAHPAFVKTWLGK
ncbi:MAG: glycine/betaine ABC transporter substrate-binding protein [Actinobacteria bacterium]|nr:MAG: glycine/betaine ABC transporter substrate-binding protein [Actinomycetota bacterium]